MPDVEEFTIGRRSSPAGSDTASDGAPWDEQGLRRLAQSGNPATLAVMDLTAGAEPGSGSVGVKEIAAHAGISLGAVCGQLAGLTMRLKNSAHGFALNPPGRSRCGSCRVG